MPALPLGCVTFLFTDIEGSTRLLHALGDRYAKALTDHRRLLRESFSGHGGVEVDTQGDSFFVAFADAGEALAAAEQGQRALAAHTWPDGGLRVRMGLHTGDPLVSDDHYVGIDVHRGARIAAAAHGGQVIVSERTRDLVSERGPPAALRDLGVHRLKDLPEAERLFQVLLDGLPSSFPPLRVHEEAIEAAGLPDYTLPPADVPCPYKGLLPFQPEDTHLFFGREQLVESLAARLEDSSFLAVVGPSGSGKSSLVRGGVVPALELASSTGLRTAIFSPGAHPLAQLRTAHEAQLLVVDQFEEVFTLCRDEAERCEFVDALLAAVEQARVVVVLRADFYGHCAAYPPLVSALEEQQALVGPMTEEELRRTIERPAEHAGLVLEPGVVEGLLRDVAGQPGGLPLLSHCLLETWKRRSGRMLTVIGYLQSGGVEGAIAKTAETVYRDSLSAAQQALARNIFLRLTELGDGTEDTRRRVAVAELIPRREQEEDVGDVLRTLADARLVTIGEGTVEVAHEALIRHWPTLREWLDEDREGRLLHRRLTEAAQEWEALERDPGALFRGTRLATTGDWATANDRELNQLEREFLTASRQASEHDAERQRRANRRLRGFLIGTTVLLLAAVAGGVVAFVQRSHARDAERVAERQALDSDAKRLGTLAGAETNLDRKLLLAVAGVRLESLPETRGALLGVLQGSPALYRFIRPSQAKITALAASPDGRLLASADSAGVVRIHDLRTWKQSGASVRLDGAVSQQAAVFSPDGRTLAVGTAGGNRVSLYTVDVGSRTPRRIGTWRSIPAVAGPLRFIRFAFSPDGRRIAVAVATATPDSPVPVAQRLLLLDAKSGEVLWHRNYRLRPGQNEVQVEFLGSGTLVTSAQQGETLLWDARKDRIERRFAAAGNFAVAPHGRLAAVALNSPNPAEPRTSLVLLDLRTGAKHQLEALPDSTWIIALQFTPDGKSVVGGSFDGAQRVWDVASGSIVETFSGQSSGATLAVLHDGSAVVTGSQGGSIAAWDLDGSHRLAPTFSWGSPSTGCPDQPCLVVNPQSTVMATDRADGTFALIDLRTHRVTGSLPARDGTQASALAFFPDGRTLATGGVNGQVTFWNVADRSLVRTLRFRDPVVWVAVSPDGKLLAVATQREGVSAARLQVEELSSRHVLYSLALPHGGLGPVFSPDGRRLAVSDCCNGGGSVEVYGARSGVKLFERHRLATAVVFSADGRLLGAGTTDGKLVLWDARTGRRVGPPLDVATAALENISFSHNGRLFAASSADQTTTLWDLRSRKRLGDSFPVREGAVTASQLTSKDNLVVVYLADAAQWPTDVRTWERFACRTAGRELTRAEWNDLLPHRPFHPVCGS